MTVYENAARALREQLPFAPEYGLVLGSGLQPLAEEITSPTVVEYAAVPGMPCPTAPGHVGRFVCGELAGKKVVCMRGRVHGYEGNDPKTVAFPVRLMKALGVKALVLTNAAGGINTDFAVGDIMLIEDQINLTGLSPLTGPNDDAVSPRFNDMTFAYAPALRQTALAAAEKCGVALRRGVYIGVNGPQFETPAEIRAFRALGADTVGMSTVLEVIAAAHCGLPVLGFSMVTNMAAGVLMQPLSGDEVNAIAAQKGKDLRRLIRAVVAQLN